MSDGFTIFLAMIIGALLANILILITAHIERSHCERTYNTDCVRSYVPER